MAYDQKADKGKLQRFGAAYFEKEKEIYAQLLRNPDEVVEGTVKEPVSYTHLDVYKRQYLYRFFAILEAYRFRCEAGNKKRVKINEYARSCIR